MKIRRATREDLPFLHEMLFEAVFWRPGAQRLTPAEFAYQPQFAKLLADWGRTGDTALIAGEAGTNIGAAWYRFWKDEDHSYGYLGPHIPELSIAVASAHRSKGVGRALLKSIVREAQHRGLPALSLSVDPANEARRLYESEGFTRAGETGTSWTYVLALAKHAAPNSA